MKLKTTRYLVSYVVDKQIKLSDVVNHLPSDLENKTTDFYEKLLNTRFLIFITRLEDYEVKRLLESGSLKLRVIDWLKENVSDVENDKDVIMFELIGSKDELNSYYKIKYFESLPNDSDRKSICEIIATQKDG